MSFSEKCCLEIKGNNVCLPRNSILSVSEKDCIEAWSQVSLLVPKLSISYRDLGRFATFDCTVDGTIVSIHLCYDLNIPVLFIVDS